MLPTQMRTYQQCEEAVDRQLKEITAPMVNYHTTDRLAFVVGFLKRQLIDLQFENECLRRDMLQTEMHQLHERLAAK